MAGCICGAADCGACFPFGIFDDAADAIDSGDRTECAGLDCNGPRIWNVHTSDAQDPDRFCCARCEKSVQAICDGCGKLRELSDVLGRDSFGEPEWFSVCDDCAAGGDPRQRGDDDGVEYDDPREVA